MVIGREPSSPNSIRKYLTNWPIKLPNGTRREYSICRSQPIQPSVSFKHIMPITHHRNIWRRLTTWIQSMLPLVWNIFMKRPNTTTLVFITKQMATELLFSTEISSTDSKPSLKTDPSFKTSKWPKIVKNTWMNWSSSITTLNSIWCAASWPILRSEMLLQTSYSLK